jgi:hypothetical protein
MSTWEEFRKEHAIMVVNVLSMHLARRTEENLEQDSRYFGFYLPTL